MTTAEDYIALEKKDVRRAFTRATEDITTEQEKLRRINPQNPLLNLISFPGPGMMDFAAGFKPIVLEHMPGDIGESLPIYAAIGHYVDLLKEEQINPKFLPRT